MGKETRLLGIEAGGEISLQQFIALYEKLVSFQDHSGRGGGRASQRRLPSSPPGVDLQFRMNAAAAFSLCGFVSLAIFSDVVHESMCTEIPFEMILVRVHCSNSRSIIFVVVVVVQIYITLHRIIQCIQI